MAENSEELVGQHFGNYRLLRILGQGGFADVYLGEHIHLNTNAAIKVLRMRLSDENINGFRREAQTIASLEHPHIVRILDFGVEKGTPFLVMGYAPNGTLRKLHPKGTILPLGTIVPYVKQVGSALQYAHNQRFVHRDVKPENMLLSRNNEVLLSDFGLALVSQNSRYSGDKEVGGTAVYMAPEQLQGQPGPASDLYSLAVVVYEWLTGAPPFEGSFAELCAQHLTRAPISPRTKNPNVSPDVEHIVLRALAKDPIQRFGSVEAFARALEQANEPTYRYAENPQVSILQPPPPPGFAPPPRAPQTPPPPPGVQASGAYPPIPSGNNYQVGGGYQAPQQANYPQSTGNFPPIQGQRGQNNLSGMQAPISHNAETITHEELKKTASNDKNQLPENPAVKKRTRGRTLGVVGVLAVLLIVTIVSAAILPSLLKGNQSNGSPAGQGSVSPVATASPIVDSNATATAAAVMDTPTASDTPAATATAEPTATPINQGKLLYQADWNKGLNGWKGSPQWKAIGNGTLGSDGSDSNVFSIIAPYRPTTADYAIEATVQYVRSTNDDYRYSFGIVAHADASGNGYSGGIARLSIDYSTQDAAFISKLAAGTFSDALAKKANTLDNAIHTYRLEVKANAITLIIDGQQILQTTDNSYLSAGQIGLSSKSTDINVTSFKVFTL